MAAGDRVWVVRLEDRHFDTAVDVYASLDGALAAAQEGVDEYEADDERARAGARPLKREDRRDGTVSWHRDGDPYIEVAPKVVQP